MENLWVSVDWPLATWSADLSAQPPDGEALLGLALDIITAGEREAVFCVLAASLIDYRRKRDGPLIEVLARLSRASRREDHVGLAGAAIAATVPSSLTVAARMAWWRASRQRREGWTTDPGRILRAQDLLDEELPRPLKRSYPAVQIMGRGFPADLLGKGALVQDVRVGFRVELHSDIWFPRIAGWGHPDHDDSRMFDNRQLAELHTPRLNRFLETIRHSVQQLGGTWGPDEEGCADNYRFLVGQAGIHLDA